MNFDNFFDKREFTAWHSQLQTSLQQRVDPKRHGDLPKWLETLSKLPDAQASHISLNQDTVTIGAPEDLDPRQAQQLHDALFALSPWRKGPYQVFGTFIDTEWRSDWKWQRVAPHITALSGRRILDVGCGTGYHCWRMLGDGADYVLGIDPSMRFLIQHQAIQKYAKDSRFDLLPLGIEDIPQDMALFDTVFSMGVLYHRRDPIGHLIELKNLLRNNSKTNSSTSNNAELVLETLVFDHIDGGIFSPAARYAQMRNVWSILTVEKTINLLNDAGFKKVRCVDQNITSLQEQRRTEWMKFHSLKEFLDPADYSKTIEGYPAPKRALFIAEA